MSDDSDSINALLKSMNMVRAPHIIASHVMVKYAGHFRITPAEIVKTTDSISLCWTINNRKFWETPYKEEVTLVAALIDENHIAFKRLKEYAGEPKDFKMPKVAKKYLPQRAAKPIAANLLLDEEFIESV